MRWPIQLVLKGCARLARKKDLFDFKLLLVLDRVHYLFGNELGLGKRLPNLSRTLKEHEKGLAYLSVGLKHAVLLASCLWLCAGSSVVELDHICDLRDDLIVTIQFLKDIVGAQKAKQ